MGYILLVFFLALLIALKFYTDHQVRKTESSFPVPGKFIQFDHYRLHYVRRGTGRPVCFIHGSFGSSYDATMSLFDRMTGSYDCIAFDRPGHGYSTRLKGKKFTLFDHAESIHAGLSELGIKKPVLVGHSLGSAVALAYAADFPKDLAGLVLVCPYVTPFKGPAHPMHQIPAIPLVGDIYLASLLVPLGQFMKRGILSKVFYPQKPPREYADLAPALALRPGQFRANAEDIRNLCKALRDLRPKLREISHPVMVVKTGADRIAPPKRHADVILREIVNSMSMHLEGVGHQPAFFYPGMIKDAVDRIWKQAGCNSLGS